MTIKEIKQMRIRGFENFKEEELLEGYSVTNSTKNYLAGMEKDLKEELCKRMSVGEQMSFEFGPTTYTASKVELDDIGFDCDEATLYTECLKLGQTIYLNNKVNTTAIKKDYKNGSLHPDITKHITVTKQEVFRIPPKTKKEEE